METNNGPGLLNYERCRIVLTTKHRKQDAIGPAIRELLSAEIVPFEFDTDTLGTFSGEIAREGTALECVRRKCELGIEYSNADYAIASEGSFGPHPSLPFIPCDYELLYFNDRRRGFCLHESLISTKTNYRMQSLGSYEELVRFGENAQFPSHALIVRPNVSLDRSVIFKGIQSAYELRRAFEECQRTSSDGNVWVETDMRAHMNPTRMSTIAELAVKLCRRLLEECPACKAPGWGMVGTEKGLLCGYCSFPTEMISSEIHGCVLCDHSEITSRPDGLTFASPKYCGRCNP